MAVRCSGGIGGAAMLWTIIPEELLLDEEDGPVSLMEMSVGGARVLFETAADGTRRVHRVLSTDPADYLRPELQPGTVWTERGP